MNNEPVAWMDKYGNICLDIDKKMNQGKITARNNYDANDIPLYTHPAKTLTDIGYETVFDGENYTTKLKEPAKTLTDEEIYEIAKECKAPWHSHAIDPMMFARAILKKASEK